MPAKGWKQGAPMATMTHTAWISIRILYEACSWALRRFSSCSSMTFCTIKQMPAKLPTATASPTRLDSTSFRSNRTQPTRPRAANTTHITAVQMAAPQRIRFSSFLDSG